VLVVPGLSDRLERRETAGNQGLPVAGLPFAHSVFTAEFVYTAASINDLLFAGIKRVTGGANLDEEVFAERRTRREFITATTGYLDTSVVGMDVGFHCLALRSTQACEKGA
jgi:hypothetical protein